MPKTCKACPNPSVMRSGFCAQCFRQRSEKTQHEHLAANAIAEVEMHLSLLSVLKALATLDSAAIKVHAAAAVALLEGAPVAVKPATVKASSLQTMLERLSQSDRPDPVPLDPVIPSANLSLALLVYGDVSQDMYGKAYADLNDAQRLQVRCRIYGFPLPADPAPAVEAVPGPELARASQSAANLAPYLPPARAGENLTTGSKQAHDWDAEFAALWDSPEPVMPDRTDRLSRPLTGELVSVTVVNDGTEIDLAPASKQSALARYDALAQRYYGTTFNLLTMEQRQAVRNRGCEDQPAKDTVTVYGIDGSEATYNLPVEEQLAHQKAYSNTNVDSPATVQDPDSGPNNLPGPEKAASAPEKPVAGPSGDDQSKAQPQERPSPEQTPRKPSPPIEGARPKAFEDDDLENF